MTRKFSTNTNEIGHIVPAGLVSIRLRDPLEIIWGQDLPPQSSYFCCKHPFTGFRKCCVLVSYEIHKTRLLKSPTKKRRKPASTCIFLSMQQNTSL